MITILQEPNKINQIRQTIPFLVYSDVLSTPNFDFIQSNFKYVFEVKTVNELGQYKSYSKVAIPPRPDNLLGFFDASSMIEAAIGFDLETHLATGVTACPNSIIEFMVICQERYLDNNNEYTFGETKVLGSYYAINSASSEGIERYIINYTTTGGTLPLHHHQLLKNDLILRSNEPLTLSWICEPETSSNQLQDIHLDYGSVDNGGFSDWVSGYTIQTGAIANSIVVNPSLSGRALKIQTANYTIFNTEKTLFKLTNLSLSNDETYTFEFWFKTNILPINNNLVFNVVPQGDIIDTVISSTPIPIYQGGYQWIKVSQKFTTATTGSTGEILVNLKALAGNLSTLANKAIVFDSFGLFYQILASNSFGTGYIMVEGDNPDNKIEWILNDFSSYSPIDSFDKARFDIPCGAFKNVTISGTTAQDVTTGLFKNKLTEIGKYFQVKLLNDASEIVGLSEKIYQDQSECDRYNKLRIKWLNELGGWEYFTFTKVSTATTTVERDKYKISRGIISNDTYSEPINERGYKPLNVKIMDTFTMVSDWINKDTLKWLQSLVTSTEVYLLNPEVFYAVPTTTQYEIEYPIFIKTNEIEYYNDAPNSKLVNLIIEVEPANNFNTNTTNI